MCFLDGNCHIFIIATIEAANAVSRHSFGCCLSQVVMPCHAAFHAHICPTLHERPPALGVASSQTTATCPDRTAVSFVPMDLAALQGAGTLAVKLRELKAAKERWEDLKLGKAKKEAETFPFPVSALLATQQPPAAKAFDVYEIPIKLVIRSLEPDVAVEVPSPELPEQLQSKIADAVLATWKKYLKKKAAPWGIMPTFEWVDANFHKLLQLDPECLHPYEGCDENDCTIKRYAIGPPAAPAPEEPESEEESEEEEEEDDAEAEAMRERLAALLAEVEHSGAGDRKKLTPEEIEQRRKEAEELGDRVKTMSKKEREEQNKSRKEKAGQRQAKTGSKTRKFEGEGATSKEEKKRKNTENVKKRNAAGTRNKVTCAAGQCWSCLFPESSPEFYAIYVQSAWPELLISQALGFPRDRCDVSSYVSYAISPALSKSCPRACPRLVQDLALCPPYETTVSYGMLHVILAFSSWKVLVKSLSAELPR
ncbi:unnamed protein product [Symbiodinium natans]|uniref:Uncharacterized protein n=1 Tax=Symbiodinium natans TaxID=878477 RepID=A0A812UWH6_9DINO|nr:unnamed protein product [Symbiodinium natans]